jgi:predicted AAA+ superfamily ATPase
MAITNHDRVGKGMELLRAGLAPFVEREFKSIHRDKAAGEAARLLGDDRIQAKKPMVDWDVAALLRVMWEGWNDVFRRTLGHAERSLVSELRDVRNRWAHQENFSGDDADRALDSAERLLSAVSASEAEEVRKVKMELRRVIFSDQARSERRRSTSTAIESQTAANLTPWREVVTPHKDVASGQYQQAEFAADLWQVHIGQGVDEYLDPTEFFRRTFLTQSLGELLAGAIKRLEGTGGDPVVQLQTNFGGGKTHSMLALYHMCSGAKPTDLAGIDQVLAAVGAKSLPKAKRVVLVGNKLSPGNPLTKPDGTVVKTLWGEMAWQLGGRKAFDRIRADDEHATNPGDVLRELFNEYGPCLVLIDEWVAYARQLHDQPDLPGGTFDTQFTFAQNLTESAKLAKQCLVVISLPASDTRLSPHATADDLEVGGERGRDALVRLRNVIGRLESSWRPASAEESFEIVRRRLFEPMLDPKQYVERDNVVRAFYEFYRSNPGEFPPDCGKSEYEKRLRDAYPIHPEVFDRLYNDWSTLVKFQRTRGVLRLMAAVIHHLWEHGDKSPMILPANIPIGDPRIQSELTRYLPDNWAAVIEKDVDGPHSLPRQIDENVPNLGRFSATRRVARAIYLGSAPITAAANLGLEDRQIKLGCVMPGEQIAVFGDALRRLAAAATFLYEDPPRYWYSTQPTVAKLAEDRAELLKRDPDKVAKALELALKQDLQKPGDFAGIHLLPVVGNDVADELECRLVVLGPDHAHVKDGPSAAEFKAKEILDSRGNAPRLNRNTLVFLAPDKARYQDLEDSLRRFLAWESILADAGELQLTPHQVKQAQTQRDGTESAVRARLPEAYLWLLLPVQSDIRAPVIWESKRVTGGEPLAVRASKKLRSDELLFPSMGGVRLRMELDRVPLWRGNHVAFRQLVEDFARYIYLPRLTGPLVLAGAAAAGVGLLTWESDAFAYAESVDETAERYRGLRGGQQTAVGEADAGLLVRPDVARAQLNAEAAARGAPSTSGPAAGAGGATAAAGASAGSGTASSVRPTRFHGTISLDPERVGRDAGRIAEEVVAHLTGIVGANVRVILEIEAQVVDGISETVERTVMENARTLKFESQGFERE